MVTLGILRRLDEILDLSLDLHELESEAETFVAQVNEAVSHDPEATWGFVGVVVSTADLSASVWRWHRDGGEWTADKVITIPAEPADPADLPPALADRYIALKAAGLL